VLASDTVTIRQAPGCRSRPGILTGPRVSFPPMNEVRLSALLCVVLLLAACDRGGPAPIRLQADDAKVLATGQAVYGKHCAACHGANLEGQPNWRLRDAAGRLPAPPHDASGHTWHHPDEVLFDITKHGVAKAANLKDYQSSMPAYEGVLSDAEILAVLSWIKSRWPAGIRQKQELVNAEAEKNKAANLR
jgi:S-disulfanyl-L-cysteine oxidoreductase SoxD